MSKTPLSLESRCDAIGYRTFMDKTYDPQKIEEHWYQRWEDGRP